MKAMRITQKSLQTCCQFNGHKFTSSCLRMHACFPGISNDSWLLLPARAFSRRCFQRQVSFVFHYNKGCSIPSDRVPAAAESTARSSGVYQSFLQTQGTVALVGNHLDVGSSIGRTLNPICHARYNVFKLISRRAIPRDVPTLNREASTLK